MNQSKLEKLGFRIEFLPSGRINLCNKHQFRINGTTAYLCTKGEFARTFEQKSISSLLSYIQKIEFV